MILQVYSDTLGPLFGVLQECTQIGRLAVQTGCTGRWNRTHHRLAASWLWVLPGAGVLWVGTPTREDRAISIFGQLNWPHLSENPAQADKLRISAPAGVADGKGPMIAPSPAPRVRRSAVVYLVSGKTRGGRATGGKIAHNPSETRVYSRVDARLFRLISAVYHSGTPPFPSKSKAYGLGGRL